MSRIAVDYVEGNLAGLPHFSLHRPLTDFARCQRGYQRAVRGDCPAEVVTHLERSYN